MHFLDCSLQKVKGTSASENVNFFEICLFRLEILEADLQPPEMSFKPVSRNSRNLIFPDGPADLADWK
jgi:hypothetical protein